MKKFHDEYSSFDFEEMVDNIADWIDTDNESRQGETKDLNTQSIVTLFLETSLLGLYTIKTYTQHDPKIYEMLKTKYNDLWN